MFINEVTLNIYVLAGIVLLSALVGFCFRAKLILKCREKIQALETEVLNSYQQVLELERETLVLENQMQDIKSPVIAMATVSHEESRVTKKVPDILLRKELLGKKNIQSASGL